MIRLCGFFRTRALLLLLMLSNCLSRSAFAASAVPPFDPQIEASLQESDLFSQEYRQDLLPALRSAERFLATARDVLRPHAYILIARLHRLRGAFKSARLALEQAESSQHQLAVEDPLLNVRLLAERRWLQIDHFSTPGVALEVINDDAACLGQDADIAGVAFRTKYREARDALLRNLPNDVPQREEGFGLSGWLYLSFMRASVAAILSTSDWQRELSTVPNFAKVQVEDLAQSVDFEVSTRMSHKTMTAERAMGMRVRLLTPMANRARPLSPTHSESGAAAVREEWATHLEKHVGAYIRDRADFSAWATCDRLFAMPGKNDPAETTLRAQAALSCAEAELFPGSTPDELGYILHAPSRAIGAFQTDNHSWLDDRRLRTWRTTARRNLGLLFLDSAEKFFTDAGLHRGSARVQYVRAADELLHALLDGAPSHPKRKMEATALEHAVRRAQRAAEQAGDLRLLFASGTLRIIVHALDGQNLRAKQALDELLRLASAEEETGLIGGQARLFAAIGLNRLVNRAESAEAELLLRLSDASYRSAGWSFEGTHSILRLVEVLKASNAHSAAIAELQRADALIEDACEQPGNLGSKLRLRADIRWQIGQLDITREDYTDLRRIYPQTEEALHQLLKCRGLKNAAIECNATDRKFSTMAAVANLALLPSWRFFVATQDDNDAIERDPDMPPQSRVRAAEAAAKLPASEIRRVALASVKIIRQELDVAKEMLKTLNVDVRSKDLKDCQSAQNPTSLRQIFCTKLTHDFVLQTRLHIMAQDFIQADKLLDVLGKEPDARWIAESSEPWNHTMLLAETRSKLGDHKQALHLTSLMIEQLEGRRAKIFDPLLQDGFLDSWDATGIFQAAVSIAAQANQPEDALRYMEKGKARAMQALMLAGDDPAVRELKAVAQSVRLRVESITALHCRSGRSATPDCTEHERALAELQRTYEERRAQQRFDAPSSEQSTELSAIKTALPVDTVLLDYFVTGNEVVTVAVRRDEPAVVTLHKIPRAELRGRVRRLVDILSRSIVDKDVQLENDTRTLSAILLKEPLALLNLQGVRRLLVVPHSELHQLPMGYLPFGDASHLIERFDLQVLPFAGYRPRIGRTTATCQRPDLGVGVLLHSSGSSYLRSGSLERDLVLRTYGLAPSRLSNRANGEMLLSALVSKSIVHVIAHGDVPVRDGFATLAMPVSTEDERHLSVLDILDSRRDFSACLTILSSCHLARGRRSAGDEYMGIPRALLEKGVGTVMGALWKIPDTDETAYLMQRLHERFRLEPWAAAAALAAEQRQAINHHVPPKVWAALVAIGGYLEQEYSGTH